MSCHMSTAVICAAACARCIHLCFFFLPCADQPIACNGAGAQICSTNHECTYQLYNLASCTPSAECCSICPEHASMYIQPNYQVLQTLPCTGHCHVISCVCILVLHADAAVLVQSTSCWFCYASSLGRHRPGSSSLWQVSGGQGEPFSSRAVGGAHASVCTARRLRLSARLCRQSLGISGNILAICNRCATIGAA